MQAPGKPTDEAARLAALRLLDLLDSAPEESFDRITRLAQELFGVPIALVSLVDEERQWFKSRQGLDATETPRDVSFCGHAILGEDTFVVEDSLSDERFVDNPLVVDAPPRVVFYAGQPLATREGHKIGTLCLIDHEPRRFTRQDQLMLEGLAAMVETELRMREIQRLQGQIDDLSGQRKRAELERDLLWDNSGDLLCVTDLEGRVTQCNPAWGSLLGIAADEVLGGSLLRLVHPDDRALALSSLERIRAAEPVEDVVLRMRQRGGNYRCIAWTVRSSDKAGRMFGSGRDITEREEIASRLAESNRELERFASVASHDLQEPLRKVQAFGDRLRQHTGNELDEKSLDYLDRMQGAATRMRALIDALLTYSRVTSKGAQPQPVSLGEVLDGVLGDLEIAIEDAGAEVVLGELPEVMADPMQLRQLLQNLLGNSLKFRREGVPPRIELLTGPIGDRYGMVRLELSDNGIGFEPRFAERIFGVFQRLHGRSEFEGTGVGLAVCRRIAERHGGSIMATGRPGEGATFTVELPVATPAPVLA